MESEAVFSTTDVVVVKKEVPRMRWLLTYSRKVLQIERECTQIINGEVVSSWSEWEDVPEVWESTK